MMPMMYPMPTAEEESELSEISEAFGIAESSANVAGSLSGAGESVQNMAQQRKEKKAERTAALAKANSSPVQAPPAPPKRPVLSAAAKRLQHLGKQQRARPGSRLPVMQRGPMAMRRPARERVVIKKFMPRPTKSRSSKRKGRRKREIENILKKELLKK